MRLGSSAQASLGRLFSEGQKIAHEASVEPLDAPLSSVPLAEGARAHGVLLLVTEVEDFAARIEGAAPSVMPRGRIVLLRPPTAEGVRGAMRRLFGAKDRVELEDVCEALLLQRLEAVRAQTIGRDGWLAWGQLR